jgi:hypothetical protein
MTDRKVRLDFTPEEYARLEYSRRLVRQRLTKEQIRERLRAAAAAEAANPPEQDEMVRRARTGEFGAEAFIEKHGTDALRELDDPAAPGER